MIGDAKLAAGGAALPNGKERNKNNVDIESPCRLKENKVPNFGERRHLIFSSLSLSFFLTCSSPLVRLKWSLPLTWVRAPFSFASRSQHATAVYSDQIFVLLRTFSLSRQLLYGFFFSFFLFQQKRKKGALSLYTEVFRCIRLYGSIRAGVAVRCYFFEASEGLLGLFFCSSSAVWPLSLMSITFFSCLRL